MRLANSALIFLLPMEAQGGQLLLSQQFKYSSYYLRLSEAF